MDETPFLVDRWKHRIVKRDGMWKLYCPARGADDLIFAHHFEWVLFALTDFPCRHGYVDEPQSHGVPIGRRVWL